MRCIVAFAACLLAATVEPQPLLAQTGAPTAKPVHVPLGEKILKDPSFFPDGNAFLLGMRDSRAGEFGSIGMDVPMRKEPAFADIQKKYGKPARSEERPAGQWAPRKGPPVDVVIHWYGEVGLAVPRAAGAKLYPDANVDGRVVWIEISPRQ
jgi:hypothetical protein